MAVTARLVSALLAAARTSFGLAGQLVVRSSPDDALALVARDRALAEDVNGELGRLMKATRRIVHENREAIQCVADALVDKFVLESDERIRELKNRRVLHSARISDERVIAFSQQVRERLRTGDPAFRRAWLHLFVDRVVIGPNEIRILGPKQALAEGLVQGNIKAGTMVPSFDREWRARHDSNV